MKTFKAKLTCRHKQGQKVRAPKAVRPTKNQKTSSSTKDNRETDSSESHRHFATDFVVKPARYAAKYALEPERNNTTATNHTTTGKSMKTLQHSQYFKATRTDDAKNPGIVTGKSLRVAVKPSVCYLQILLTCSIINPQSQSANPSFHHAPPNRQD
jgi:hypothetical protein